MCTFISLPVDPPNVTTVPVDQVKNKSDTVDLFCHFSGNPSPKVHWYMSTIKLSTNNRVLVSMESEYSGELGLYLVTSNLHISYLQSSDEALYLCAGENNVTNFIGSIQNASAYVIVQGNCNNIPHRRVITKTCLLASMCLILQVRTCLH